MVQEERNTCCYKKSNELRGGISNSASHCITPYIHLIARAITCVLFLPYLNSLYGVYILKVNLAVFWIICVDSDRGGVYLEDMRARLVRYAQESVRVPMGVPTTPTRTVWKPVQKSVKTSKSKCASASRWESELQIIQNVITYLATLWKSYLHQVLLTVHHQNISCQWKAIIKGPDQCWVINCK